jgi:hypothetical protein
MCNMQEIAGFFFQKFYGKIVNIRIPARNMNIIRKGFVSDRDDRNAPVNVVSPVKRIPGLKPALLLQEGVGNDLREVAVSLGSRSQIEQKFFRAGMEFRVELVNDV